MLNGWRGSRREWSWPGAALLCLMVLGVFAGVSVGQTALVDQLTRLNGETLSGQIKSIRDGMVRYDGSAPPVAFLELKRIDRPVTAATPRGTTAAVYLTSGGVIYAREATLVDGEVALRWTGGISRLPLSQVSGLLFTNPSPDTPPRTEFLDAVSDREAREDQLLAIRDDKMLQVGGLLVGMDGSSLSFEMSGSQRSIERSRVYGVTIAHPGAQVSREGWCEVTFNDGSTVWGRMLSMEDGDVRLGFQGEGELTARWSSVRAIRIRSDRVVYLSDTKPVRVQEDPLLDHPRPWRADLNVRGGPLVLGERTFEKGLGVRSRSELTFAAEGEYSLFLATIGIDANTRPEGKGDCVFVVIGDGKELYRQRVERSDEPRDVTVSIDGVEQVTLLVAYGEDLSFADHANWCDARFVKEERTGVAGGSSNAGGDGG